MHQKLDHFVFFNDDLDLNDRDSNIASFFTDGIGSNTVVLNLMIIILTKIIVLMFLLEILLGVIDLTKVKRKAYKKNI